MKISNVRNDRGLVSVRLLNGERVQTNLRKMGALVGDGSQIGCNSVTNPGALIGPNSMINPNETVTGYFGVVLIILRKMISPSVNDLNLLVPPFL